MKRILQRILRKRVLALAALAAAVAGLAAPTASALNPNVTSEARLAELVLADLDSFWLENFESWAYDDFWGEPGLYFYNTGPGSNYRTSCGDTIEARQNSFYCGIDETIYLDFRWNQGLLRRHGDGVAAFILAHEYAHHVQLLLEYPFTQPGYELNADCLAGIYFRYAIDYSGLLNRGDLGEARALLKRMGGGDGSHGTGAQRLRWFNAGFNQYDMDVCYGAL